MTASGGNLIGCEVNRNERAPQWGVATIEIAARLVSVTLNLNERAPQWGVATIEIAARLVSVIHNRKGASSTVWSRDD
jgi:hypothetical protein